MQKTIDQVMENRQISLGGMSAERFVRIFYTIASVFSLVIGGVLILLGGFVRRASKASVVIATIICGLASVYFVLSVLQGARLGLGGDMMSLFGGCFLLVPLSLFGLATLWLVQLLRALPGIQAARLQFQSQFHQRQQQQHLYNHYGGAQGYGGFPVPGNPSQPTIAPPAGQGYAMPPQAGSTGAAAANPTPQYPKSEPNPNDPKSE
jgi:hypothetical protein